MVTRKNILLASVFAGALGLVASTSFASGPIVLGPSVAPVMPKLVATQTGQSTMQTKALSIYRQVRSFWLSRAIVR